MQLGDGLHLGRERLPIDARNERHVFLLRDLHLVRVRVRVRARVSVRARVRIGVRVRVRFRVTPRPTRRRSGATWQRRLASVAARAALARGP